MYVLQPLESPTVNNRELDGVSTGVPLGFNRCHQKKSRLLFFWSRNFRDTMESGQTAKNNLSEVRIMLQNHQIFFTLPLYQVCMALSYAHLKSAQKIKREMILFDTSVMRERPPDLYWLYCA